MVWTCVWNYRCHRQNQGWNIHTISGFYSNDKNNWSNPGFYRNLLEHFRTQKLVKINRNPQNYWSTIITQHRAKQWVFALVLGECRQHYWTFIFLYDFLTLWQEIPVIRSDQFTMHSENAPGLFGSGVDISVWLKLIIYKLHLECLY